MSTYEISKSSLLSLKAEILKKQDEVNKSKLENKNRIQTPKTTPLEIKNKGLENRLQNDLSEEEENLLKKSRSVLEAKAKLYDKLSSGSALDDETQRKYLVHFNKKLTNVCPTEFDNDEDDKRIESDEDDVNYDEYKADNSDEEWIEYTDCLGRTRTCLKKDLQHNKQKDEGLRSSVDCNTENVEVVKEPIEEEIVEENEMLSSDMRREMLRRKWEKEEDELRNKNDLHYQDILFGEARSHGVGYYGFSKDEEERATQQNALKNLRKETIEQQKLAQEMKRNRDRQLAARIRSAKNRKRARLGLPLLTSDDEDEQIIESEPEKPVKPEPTAEEKLKSKTDEIKRKLHIRPWDMGKEGVKEHYELSQEEWVRLQRKKREGEFAPPRAYHSTMQKSIDTSVDDNKGLYFTSNKKIDLSKPPPDVRNPSKKHLNPYKTKEYIDELPSEVFVAEPMQDECVNDDDEDDRLLQDFHQIQNQRVGGGVEVPPPPTYDYYGPSSSKRSKSAQPTTNMSDSIMEGLKFLRNKVEKKRKD